MGKTMKKIAKMPANKIKTLIRQAPIGKIFYTFPWAITVTPDRYCHVRADTPCYGYCGGGFKIPMMRIKGGIVLNITEYSSEDWNAENLNSTFEYIPVFDLFFDFENLRKQ